MRTFSLAFVIGSVALLTACEPTVPGPSDMPSSAPAMEASSSAAAPASMMPSSKAQPSSVSAMKPSSAAPQAAARVVEVSAEDWKFTPAVITAKKGEKLTLKLVGKSGIHGVSFPGLGINERVEAGQTITVSVNTDTAGTYDGFCSIPCGAGHRDMKISIVIS